MGGWGRGGVMILAGHSSQAGALVRTLGHALSLSLLLLLLLLIMATAVVATTTIQRPYIRETVHSTLNL